MAGDEAVLTARDGTDSQLTLRSEEEVFLLGTGCPICAHSGQAEGAFFRWWSIESFAERRMHQKLRESAGFCPAHERRVLPKGHLAPLPAVVRGALDVLGHRGRGRAECPACEVVAGSREHAERLLLLALGQAELREAYRDRAGGTCVPHVVRASERLPEEDAAVLLDKLRQDLRAGCGFHLVAGEDPDAASRAALRRRLVATPSTSSLDIDACPVCHAGGEAESAYLIGACSNDGELAFICPRHLHDLARIDPVRGRLSEEAVRGWWLEASGTSANASFACPVCRLVAEAEQRELELLLRTLADASQAETYRESHGLCLRHALLDGARASALVREVLDARLRVLGWEIEEAHRKRGWGARHEPTGSERTARLRLAAQLDGRTFLGRPAVELAPE